MQQSNCHPFRYGDWLWMHNGYLDGFHTMKRDLAMAVDPGLYADIEGTTDTEILFFLALTFGLADDPPAAVARAVGLVEEVARGHGIPFPVQMTVATTDGSTTWAFRYSSEGTVATLYHSVDVSTLREQYPDNPTLHGLSDDARLVVSEPLGDLRGAWREVPEASCVAIHGGTEEMLPFAPIGPGPGCVTDYPSTPPGWTVVDRRTAGHFTTGVTYRHPDGRLVSGPRGGTASTRRASRGGVPAGSGSCGRRTGPRGGSRCCSCSAPPASSSPRCPPTSPGWAVGRTG